MLRGCFGDRLEQSSSACIFVYAGTFDGVFGDALLMRLCVFRHTTVFGDLLAGGRTT